MRGIQKSVFRLADFLDWQRSGTLVLSPAFQRRPVWSRVAKSFLLDSIIRGIPIPIIFLRAKTDLKHLLSIREVVDGQQRLRTLLAFIDPKSVRDFHEERDAVTLLRVHNTELAGKSFGQLSSSVRKDILDYELSVHVLPSDTDDREVLQIFARMNSTGLKLNDQELRNAAFFGAFKELSYQLAFEQLDRWRSWKIYTETDIARMQEAEETSDLIITMLAGVHGKNQRLIDRYYADNDESFRHGEEAARRYRSVMGFIDAHLGDELHTMVFRRKPLFHTLFTFYYDLAFGLDTRLTKAKPRVVPKSAAEAVRVSSSAIASGNLPEELGRLLRGATGHKPSRTARLEFLRESFARVNRQALRAV